jgi:hypothetical protein
MPVMTECLLLVSYLHGCLVDAVERTTCAPRWLRCYAVFMLGTAKHAPLLMSSMELPSAPSQAPRAASNGGAGAVTTGYRPSSAACPQKKHGPASDMPQATGHRRALARRCVCLFFQLVPAPPPCPPPTPTTPAPPWRAWRLGAGWCVLLVAGQRAGGRGAIQAGVNGASAIRGGGGKPSQAGGFGRSCPAFSFQPPPRATVPPPLQFGLQRWGVRLHLFLAGSRGVLNIFLAFELLLRGRLQGWSGYCIYMCAHQTGYRGQWRD